MKTELIDFVYSTIALTLLSLAAFFVAAFVATTLEPQLGIYTPVLAVLAFLLAFGLMCAICTRLIMKFRPLEAGKHAMDTPLFTRWKLFTVIYEFGRGALLPFSVVFAKPPLAALFGASIGKDIALGGHLVDPEFISIGDEAIIGQGSVVSAHTITSGYLVLAPVVIGKRATVGVNAVVMSGVQLGDDSVLTPGTTVPPDTVIPPGELWGGNPARKIKSLAPEQALAD